MQKFNPEIDRVSISKVIAARKPDGFVANDISRLQESEWIQVSRDRKKLNLTGKNLQKVKSDFICCTKASCNSIIHKQKNCWWIHPERRPNIQKQQVPKQTYTAKVNDYDSDKNRKLIDNQNILQMNKDCKNFKKSLMQDM